MTTPTSTGRSTKKTLLTEKAHTKRPTGTKIKVRTTGTPKEPTKRIVAALRPQRWGPYMIRERSAARPGMSKSCPQATIAG
jgi:hypothetical protein